MALSKKTLVALMSMLMSEISQDAYCASWEMGSEYAIWDVVHGLSSDLRWKNSISSEQIIMLRELSAEIDGWLIYDERGESCVRRVSADEWQRTCEARKTEPSGRRKAEVGTAN